LSFPPSLRLEILKDPQSGRHGAPHQAAQTAKRSPEFSATYAAISKRRGKKIATIAISRKLLTRAYHLLAAAQAGQVISTPGTAGNAPADQERVAKPRARSLHRHEPA
jgi:hypothetical protein